MYYVDPFTYVVQSLFTQTVWDIEVKCATSEVNIVSPPPNQTCGSYMAEFLSSHAGYIRNPDASFNCEYCQYSMGSNYAKTYNINTKYYGWRGVNLALICSFSVWLLTGCLQ